MDNKLKIFSGRGSSLLAKKIANYLGYELGKVSIKTFSDGELWVKFEENIRGHDVFIIQSTNSPAENILELTLMIDAAVRASAKRVTVVIPYFGYGRQDRKDQPRVPISSRVMIDIFESMGTNRIITMDLHSTQIQGFAKVPFDNLYSRSVIFDAIKDEKLNPETSVVLAPDMGSVKMSQGYAKNLGINFAITDKRRYAPNKTQVSHLIGELDNRDVLIIDDMIDTAGTLVNAAKAAFEKGARSVIAIATHGVLSGEALERLEKSQIKKIIITDTIEMSKEKIIDKIKIVSVSKIFSEAVSRIHKGESVSALFEFQKGD
ncbi:MAG: ribose-phosphate pyrophosphokinase [Candidatus Marinimicrobia bacterium]|nr:ribose-phosphate pyrophosphokinase [Candidatus Neomarinimicrobiota bacterium]